MQIGAQKSVTTAPNCRSRVSMSNRRGTSAQVRPNALSVSPRITTRSVSTEQSSRGEECQTSTRDQGEQPDGRVHRRTRCRKRQNVADTPRFNGSVLPAYVERSRYVCPAEPDSPSGRRQASRSACMVTTEPRRYGDALTRPESISSMNSTDWLLALVARRRLTHLTTGSTCVLSTK